MSTSFWRFDLEGVEISHSTVSTWSSFWICWQQQQDEVLKPISVTSSPVLDRFWCVIKSSSSRQNTKNCSSFFFSNYSFRSSSFLSQTKRFSSGQIKIEKKVVHRNQTLRAHSKSKQNIENTDQALNDSKSKVSALKLQLRVLAIQSWSSSFWKCLKLQFQF